MLSRKAALGVPSVVRQASRHLPASAVALSRIIGARQYGATAASPPVNSYPRPRILGTAEVSNKPVKGSCYPQFGSRRWLSSHPICELGDSNIARELSPEDYDNAYKYVYHQHNHMHGPWLRTLQTAQKVLHGIHSPRILVIGSGPGEPAATLAANFQDADVISAHSTKKCVDWASERFRKHDLHNVATRLVPSMEQLDMFADGSFDLVACCYGLANSPNPQEALNEIHRVLKPSGTFLVSVWENAPADPASDIILRHACVGPNPWHKGADNRDMVGNYACPVRSKRPMSLSKPHLLENMLEKASLKVIEVDNAEYPLHLGKDKRFAFHALTLPIRSELQELAEVNHFHCNDAAEAFEDVLKEGFMVKQHEDGEMEVPYNVYKFVVARREFEDGDMTKETKSVQRRTNALPSLQTVPINPVDVREDPVYLETWNRMKSAASDKIVNAVRRQVDGFKHDSPVKILDVAPTPYSTIAIDVASSHPYATVVATSKSVKIVEEICEEVVKHGLSNMKVKALDASHMTTFQDKSFDVIVCSFGLAFASSPADTLKEFYRLLKPGGSLVLSVWEDLSLAQLSNFIVDEMHANGYLQDYIDLDSGSPGVLSQLTPYAKPRELEGLVSDCGFAVNHVDHETAKIILSEASCNKSLEHGVNVATLAIRPFLQELERSGENRNAFAEAKKAFESLLNDPSLVSRDTCGNLVTTLPSRFKIVTATRQYKDSDGYLDNNDTSEKVLERKTIKVSDIPK